MSKTEKMKYRYIIWICENKIRNQGFWRCLFGAQLGKGGI